MDRRYFLKALAGGTAGLMVLPHSTAAEPGAERDRLGELLPQRLLGRTGEKITMLGLGGSHVGLMKEKEAQAVIEAALEGGIRFFDNAESYQGGRAERYYGLFLSPKYRDITYIMTKTTAGDAATARKHLDESLERLKTGHVDLWQVHAVTSADDVDKRIDHGILDVMLEAKASGKARHIGFTGHSRYTAHLRVLEKSEDIFDTCQMPMNVADPSHESFINHVLPILVQRNIGVIAMKSLANGGFFGGRAHMQHGPHPRVVPHRISIEEALHFVWSLPVSVLVTGPNELEHLLEKIAFAKSFRGMTAEDRQALIEKVADMTGPDGPEFYKQRGRV
jgi:uncharacterized protein